MLAGATGPRPKNVRELISAEFCGRLDRLDVLSRRIFAGKMHGERRSKRRGQSVEFEDYRNYVPGDDLRHVDWNVFARLDRFFIKVFQHEEDLSCHVVLDASASMEAGVPTKLTAAQRAAMALAYVSLVNNNRVTMSVFDGESLRWIGPTRGRRSVQLLGRFLLDHAWPAGTAGRPEAGATPSPALGVSGFTGAMRAVAQMRSGKGVMILLSDFLISEGYADGLRYLAGGGYDTWCLQVLSPGELDPSKEGAGRGTAGAPGTSTSPLIGDVALLDVETGRIAEVTITTDLLRSYRESVRRYIEDLRSYCAARDMTHVLVTSDADIEELVISELRRRRLLR